MLIALAVLACACAVAAPEQGTSPADIVAEFDRLAAQPLWPGFDPRNTPIAIYDGERTWLFRHPGPPEGFTRDANHEGAWTCAGQHPAVRANTSAELGGVTTATFILDPAAHRTLTQSAGIVLHESFHVFQRKNHPKWSPNEAELFVYPVDDGPLLQLRRLETEALRRALQATNQPEAAGWAKLALALRTERFAKLPASSADYERGTELNEGLAAYVEGLATGSAANFPADEFPAEAVRLRSYTSGRALGKLLDRFDTGWKAKLEAGTANSLDALLAAALAGVEAPPQDFSSAERQTALQRAAADASALHARKAELRKNFFAQPGWTVVILADGPEPLWPQGFDPLNVQRLSATEVLHTRFLKLGNAAATIEVLNRQSLTEAAGAHPLFNGARRLTVTGLPAEPLVNVPDSGEKVVIQGEGFEAQVQDAVVDTRERTVTVTLGSKRSRPAR